MDLQVNEFPQPHSPPIQTADLPGTGGRQGPEPEDFVVDEVPLYEPCGDGEHLYVRVKKRRQTTPDVTRILARAAGVHPRDVGYAGMKDKHAVTTQWISLPQRASAPEGWSLPEGVEITGTSRHRNKLRLGHASGNRFQIRLTDVAPGDAERAEAIAARLRAGGLRNYFGYQRFGRGGHNLGAALALVTGDDDRRRGRFDRKLLTSVLQAEVFNRYLTARATRGLDQLLAGEVVRLEGKSALFTVDEPDAELGRLRDGSIHLTGPMIGPKMKAAAGVPLELERAAIGDAGLDEGRLARLAKHGPGTRRDLTVPLTDLTLHAADDRSLRLSFFLPSGSYATQVIRELTRVPFTSA